TACTFSSELNLVIKKLHLQLVVVSNNWGAVHQEPVVFGLPFSYLLLFSAEKQSMCHILFPLTKLANTAHFN
ncbi:MULTISPECIES: hypothetical protein, partial [unclassified Paenibacillus]|uniref:hypothetical protein n=1 Tax=unclassified Paenibacillus TaxID=185978 RepID=UPI0009C87151